MLCRCNHTFRQHQTAQGYCGYCNCETFVQAAVQPTKLKPPAPESAVAVEPVAQTEETVASAHNAPARGGLTSDQIKAARDEAEAHPNHILASYLLSAVDEIENLRKEFLRVVKEGSPGVMHAIDRDFYKLVIKERDSERHRVEMLRSHLRDAEQHKSLASEAVTAQGKRIEELAFELATLKAALPQCAVCAGPLLPGNAEIGNLEKGIRAHASCEAGLKDLEAE